MPPDSTASVQALLARLRASQAWHEAVGTSAPAAADPPPEPDEAQEPPAIASLGAADAPKDGSTAAATSSQLSVASLLSQLQGAAGASAHPPAAAIAQQLTEPPADYGVAHAQRPSALLPDPALRERAHADLPPPRKQDLRNVSYQQALPIIAQLSQDQAFIDAIRKLKNDQILLEKRLWEERQAIQKRHEEKVKVARTKASMIGASLSKFDADSMTDAFRRELQRFDRERVLPAWDGLITKQQSTLESLGVPTMFPTVVSTERQKQQRVVQVVSGVIE